MKILKTVPLFLFLLVVFFILHGTVENFGFIYPSELFKVGFTILICVSLFYLVTKLLVKKTVHAALICFFISTWILFFGAIFEWVKSTYILKWLHSYTVFIPFMLCVFIVFILFIRKRKALQNKLCFYLNVLLLIYCLYDFGALVLKAVQTKTVSFSTAISFDTAAVKAKPNVYFLLFDEYPGYKSLKDSFAFANDDLYQFLEKKDFKFLPVFSNYNMTAYSMASMFNMQYNIQPSKPLVNTTENERLRIIEIKNAQVFKCFASMGYTFINNSIFDIAEQPKVSHSVITQNNPLTHKILFNKLLSDIGWNFISGKYGIPYIRYHYFKGDRNNKSTEMRLNESINSALKKPQFIYSHFIMPHPEIYRDSTGAYLKDEVIFNFKTNFNKPLFLSYLKYTNTKIKNFASSIAEKDPEAVVIIMSDHGYKGYNNNNSFTPLLFDNICAVKFPEKNYMPMKEKWSNVNFFRYLFNCEFNQKITYLPDSSFFLKEEILQTAK